MKINNNNEKKEKVMKLKVSKLVSSTLLDLEKDEHGPLSLPKFIGYLAKRMIQHPTPELKKLGLRDNPSHIDSRVLSRSLFNKLKTLGKEQLINVISEISHTPLSKGDPIVGRLYFMAEGNPIGRSLEYTESLGNLINHAIDPVKWGVNLTDKVLASSWIIGNAVEILITPTFSYTNAVGWVNDLGLNVAKLVDTEDGIFDELMAELDELNILAEIDRGLLSTIKIEPYKCEYMKEKSIRYENSEVSIPKGNGSSSSSPRVGSLTSPSITPEKSTKEKNPNLNRFGTNLIEKAKSGDFDKIVGRDAETDQLVEILCCRKKNNAMIIGEPGTGKTALIEGLAQRIASKNVPAVLKDKVVYSIDLTLLVCGTKFRGEYEQRLQSIIEEVKSDPNVIVYIDEIHNLVGQGGNAGNGDGANILKPSLSRGEFQCIGSTTFEEYRKYIEKDGALKRRFQNVQVLPPTVEETISILTGVSKSYSEYHRVKYSKQIIAKCVEWSGRYITDRMFPDKALDCLDLAGSLAKLRQIEEEDATDPNSSKELDNLRLEYAKLVELKLECVRNQDFIEASSRKRESEEVMIRIKAAERQAASVEKRKPLVQVTEEDVARVVSKISNVPFDRVMASDMATLREMKSNLSANVIGQSTAVEDLVMAIQRNSLGLRDETKPIASFLFVGPTGVGKTLICKELAKQFFGSIDSLIRFDMGEFTSKSDVTKLIGSTASYIGYEDSPLMEQVRRKPYSVVLFDEIEKAHPEIYNILLSILDEGLVTLGNGMKVDFKNTIIIFTGNIGTKELMMQGNGLGFTRPTVEAARDRDKSVVIKAVKSQFKPELINRLSGITVFNSLQPSDLGAVLEIELGKLKSRLLKSKMKLSIAVKPGLKARIISQADLKYGARDLHRNITKFIEDEVCNALLDSQLSTVKLATLDWVDGKVAVTLK